MYCKPFLFTFNWSTWLTEHLLLNISTYIIWFVYRTSALRWHLYDLIFSEVSLKKLENLGGFIYFRVILLNSWHIPYVWYMLLTAIIFCISFKGGTHKWHKYFVIRPGEQEWKFLLDGKRLKKMTLLWGCPYFISAASLFCTVCPRKFPSCFFVCVK